MVGGKVEKENRATPSTRAVRDRHIRERKRQSSHWVQGAVSGTTRRSKLGAGRAGAWGWPAAWTAHDRAHPAHAPHCHSDAAPSSAPATAHTTADWALRPRTPSPHTAAESGATPWEHRFSGLRPTSPPEVATSVLGRVSVLRPVVSTVTHLHGALSDVELWVAQHIVQCWQRGHEEGWQ